MRTQWTVRALTLRIDRCYLVAGWARAAEKRERYLQLARHYRQVLAAMTRGSRRPAFA